MKTSKIILSILIIIGLFLYWYYAKNEKIYYLSKQSIENELKKTYILHRINPNQFYYDDTLQSNIILRTTIELKSIDRYRTKVVLRENYIYSYWFIRLQKELNIYQY